MGFDYCGIAKAQELTEDALRLEQWLHKGFHGEMEYMANNFDLRIDPRKLRISNVVEVTRVTFPQFRSSPTRYVV